MSGLILKDVSKTFAGKLVVDKISFTLNQPGVYGLLGTNGAGKTTTIRMLLGIITKDSGEITWNDKPVDRKTVNFGYLPEERGVYPKVKIFDQLLYFAELKGMSRDDASIAINKWAKRLKVEEYLPMAAEKLSKGNQQKIQFMTAVIHNPDLVVLDEPFSGLDPVNTDIIKSIIIDLVRQGKFIIMSAHQMATIEEFCTNILILNRGKPYCKGTLKTSNPPIPPIVYSSTLTKTLINIFKNLKSKIPKTINTRSKLRARNPHMIYYKNSLPPMFKSTSSKS